MTLPAAIILCLLLVNFVAILLCLGQKKTGAYGAGDIVGALLIAWLLYMGNFFAVTPVTPTHSVEKAP